MNLLRGQRINLLSLIPEIVPFSIRVVINTPSLVIDFSSFGLSSHNQLTDDRYMSFFNQPVTPCGAVRYESRAQNTAIFLIDLKKIPFYIERLHITAAIDGDGTMSQIISGSVTLGYGNVEAAHFDFKGNDFVAEKSLMLMEIYRKDGNWRVSATGQGFNGGLAALVRHFGGTVSEQSAEVATQSAVLGQPPERSVFPVTEASQTVEPAPEVRPHDSKSPNIFERAFKQLFGRKIASETQPVKMKTNDMAIKQAKVAVSTLNSLLNDASQSKPVNEREISLNKAQEALIKLKRLADQHPFLQLQNLQAVESRIMALENEIKAISHFVIPQNSNPKANSPPDLNHANDYWKPKGASIKIANTIVDGGLLYFGSGLTSLNSSQSEPALINPKLPISHIASADYQQRHLSYWPSYAEATPAARAAYIKWLSEGRNAPLADIGYVFLYFYGLERRVLLDSATNSAVKAELPAIMQEIERLLKIYHANNSFRGYATGFLELLKLDCLVDLPAKQYLAPPPSVDSGAWTVPLALKVPLGQLAMDNEPLPADWAYAWLLTDGATRLTTPAKRCAIEFKKLFMTDYANAFGNGLKLPINKTKIKISYTAASGSFFGSRTIERKLDLPDVTVLTSCIKKLQSLASQCSETLNSYSRLLGRNPELAGTLDALLELPYLLWPDQPKQSLKMIGQALKTTNTPVILEFKQLQAELPEWQTVTKPKIFAFIKRLAEAGLGMEPDIRFGGAVPNTDTKIVLFMDDGLWAAPNPRYTTAALTLQLAVMVAIADGEIGQAESALLIQQIESGLHLEPAEKNRLHAHLRWLRAQPPDFKKIKKQLETLPLSAREVLADFLVLIAHADNKISANEVKILEKIYKVLQLDVQSLYGKLHGRTGADEPVTVRPPSPATTGFAIPKPVQATDNLQLDMQRIAALKNESQKVTEMLATLFEQEAIPEASTPVVVDIERHDNLFGLDDIHTNLLKLLCARVQWSRVELEEIAADAGIMLDGVLESINEAAYDAFDVPFTEGDDPIEINQDIAKELFK